MRANKKLHAKISQPTTDVCRVGWPIKMANERRVDRGGKQAASRQTVTETGQSGRTGADWAKLNWSERLWLWKPPAVRDFERTHKHRKRKNKRNKLKKNTHTKNVNVFAVIQQSVCLNVSIIVADQRRRRNTTYSWSYKKQQQQ